ncbi:MAG: hypothetical protein V4805_21155 [Pseudomonadota bacterium]
MKSNVKKTLLAHLLLGAGALSVTAPSQAVSLSQDGVGQVLIYPYYTVRGGFDTYLSVVNHTSQAKALKVRFRESKNGREVLNFNLYLGGRDVWTAAVVATPQGAKMITADKSCTAPGIPAGGVDFVNFAFNGVKVPGLGHAGGDGEDQSLDRTREGYFEIIEMGTITSSDVALAVSHQSGIPANCDLVQTSAMDMSIGGGATAAAPPSGGLSGTVTLINVSAGTDYSHDPVVLSGFSNVNLWQAPGSTLPDLSSATPKTSLLIKDDVAVASTWARGVDAVSALLMHDSLFNEFVMEPTTLSGTDWVVTMPTKHFYVPVVGNPVQPVAPFGSEFDADLGGACEVTVKARFEPVAEFPGFPTYDRAQEKISSPDMIFIGVPDVPTLCWESSVFTFIPPMLDDERSNVLHSPLAAPILVLRASFTNGWMEIPLAGSAANVLTSRNGDIYKGLPAIGFMVQDFVNGNVNGLLSNYGGSFNHKYTRSINGK